jgi:hypothetical protein
VYATNLAAVCRNAGLRVVEVPGWQTRGHGGLTAVKTIVCHHTAGPSAAADPSSFPSLKVVRDGRFNQRTQQWILKGPLCNLGLGRDGIVYAVAAGLAYHAGQVRDPSYANAYSLGIEAENDGIGEPWPPVQMAAYVRLCAALANAYKLSPARVLAHREVCAPVGRKIDPTGIVMPTFRAQVARVADGLRQPSRSIVRVVRPAFTLARVLEEVGPGKRPMAGPDVRAVQRRLMELGHELPRWGADAVYGDETADAVEVEQRRRRLRPDREVGPVTARALGGKWAG